MVEHKKVSVIIPVYNGARYIGQAIDSAISQDTDCEVIVIDDGSTDDLDKVMEKYADNSAVRFFHNEVQMGVAKSRNRGVSLSEAEYVAFLDADDFWMEGKLEKQLAAMSDTGAVLSSTARELMTPEGESTGRIIGIPERIEYKDILRHNMIPCSGVVIKRDVMEKYPMEHDDSHEDYIAWIRIIKEYGLAVGINEPLLKYRLSEGGKSRNKFKSAKMTFKVYRYCGFGFFASLKHFISYAFNGVRKYYG